MARIIKRNIHTIDATGESLGRLATKVATLLRGKQKPDFRSYLDYGDFVKMINLKQAKFTGNKFAQKVHHRHSGYPGGLTSTQLSEEWVKRPEKVFTRVVKGMLPKTKLTKDWLKRLQIIKD